MKRSIEESCKIYMYIHQLHRSSSESCNPYKLPVSWLRPPPRICRSLYALPVPSGTYVSSGAASSRKIWNSTRAAAAGTGKHPPCSSRAGSRNPIYRRSGEKREDVSRKFLSLAREISRPTRCYRWIHAALALLLRVFLDRRPVQLLRERFPSTGESRVEGYAPLVVLKFDMKFD